MNLGTVFRDPSPTTKWSAFVLVATNLVVAVSALVGAIDVGDVFLLYWAESAVILFFSLLNVVRVSRWAALGLVPFFIVHAGIFMLVHLVFILFLFIAPTAPGSKNVDAAFDAIKASAMAALLPALGLFASHAFAWITHFRDGKPRNAGETMGGFYGRIVIMQVSLIFGGMATMALGSPVWAVALLVLLKTTVDLVSHLHKHRRKDDVEVVGPADPNPS